MSWAAYHAEASRLAGDADIAARKGDSLAAAGLYREAAEAEERALGELDPAKSRTLAVTAVSAASLYYKAGLFNEAEQLAYRHLTNGALPSFARQQLQELVQYVWTERARSTSNVKFASGQVAVSVRGGSIVTGGAPLDLILKKGELIRSLLLRTAEFLTGLPHRRRGAPTKTIQECYTPWIFQAPPGSYQFIVAIEEHQQKELFPSGVPGAQVSKMLLTVLESAASEPQEGLGRLIPDPDYRTTFVKLIRDLAPTGKTFSELAVRPAGGVGEPICLSPTVRSSLQNSLRANALLLEADESSEVLKGVLRAVHLDQDWLEIVVGDTPMRIDGVGATVDDVIGPMVNHPVEVDVVRRRGKLILREIQADD